MFHLADAKLESSVIVLYDLHYDTRNLVDDLDSLLHEILPQQCNSVFNVCAVLLRVHIIIYLLETASRSRSQFMSFEFSINCCLWGAWAGAVL